MAHLDITIDFETCGLGVNAAPLQLAAVAWNRNAAGESPFFISPVNNTNPLFNIGVDLRTCFMLGMEIDNQTAEFWQKQDLSVRNSVLALEPCEFKEAIWKFVDWVKAITVGFDSYTIWAQGSDFDIAKINEYARKAGAKLPWKYTQARCARTFIIENGATFLCGASQDAMLDPSIIYNRIPAMPKTIFDGATHDAIYDCHKTTWNVWQIMKAMSHK